MKTKKIILITPGFPANEEDTQCIPALQLYVQALSKTPGIEVSVVTLHYPKRKTKYLWHNIAVFPCYSSFPLGRSLIWWKGFRYLLKLKKGKKTTVLHSFWLSDATLIALMSNYFLRKPHWITLMGQDALAANKYLRFLPLHKMKLIALSPFHAEVFKKSTGLNVKGIIPWGIDWGNINKPVVSRSIDILGVGNLIPLKCFELFIEFVARLKKEGISIKAVLIGGGSEMSRLKRMVIDKGIEAAFSFTGPLPRAEVKSYMEQSSILFHPSKYESFGLVLIEAQQMGLQVVTRPVGIAQTAPGFWLGLSEDALYEALKAALNTPNKHMYNGLFPITNTVNQYLAIYNNY